MSLLEENIAKGQPTALVDLSKHFDSAETVLPQLIEAGFPVNRLLAYAGWNTTSNALGTAIGSAVALLDLLPDRRHGASHVQRRAVGEVTPVGGVEPLEAKGCKAAADPPQRRLEQLWHGEHDRPGVEREAVSGQDAAPATWK